MGIEDEEAEAGIVIDIEDTKTWKGIRIGGIDRDHKNEIGMEGEGHGRGAFSAGGPTRKPASHEGIAAIRLTHDAGIDPGRDLETEATTDTAETDHRRDVCNTISEGQPQRLPARATEHHRTRSTTMREPSRSMHQHTL